MDQWISDLSDQSKNPQYSWFDATVVACCWSEIVIRAFTNLCPFCPSVTIPDTALYSVGGLHLELTWLTEKQWILATNQTRHKKPSIRLCYARPRSTSIRWNSEARVARLNVHSTRDLEPWLPEPSWTMDNTARCQNLKILDCHPPTGIPVKMLQLGYLYLEVASPHLLPTMRSSPCGSPGPCVSGDDHHEARASEHARGRCSSALRGMKWRWFLLKVDWSVRIVLS